MPEESLKDSFKNGSLQKVKKFKGDKEPTLLSTDDFSESPKILEPPRREQNLMSSPNNSLIEENEAFSDTLSDETGKLEKFHVKQDVNPIPLDSTTHNSSETPKILGPHCGNKNLKKCLYCLKKKCLYCQATGGSCLCNEYLISIESEMEKTTRTNEYMLSIIKRMISKVKQIELKYNKMFAKKKINKN